MLAESRVNAKVENVCLTGRHRENRVADYPALALNDDAVLSGQEAIAKDAMAPRKLVTPPFYVRHLAQVAMDHRPDDCRNFSDRRDHVGCSAIIRRASTRSCQALRFCVGLRSR